MSRPFGCIFFQMTTGWPAHPVVNFFSQMTIGWGCHPVLISKSKW